MAAKDLAVGMPTRPPNIAHMPMAIAQGLGLYKIYGMTVKLVEFNGGVNVFRAMAAGNLDVRISPATVRIIAAVLKRVERWIAPWRRAEI